MANNINIDSKLLINDDPGKPGDVITSRGDRSPAWTPASKLISKVKAKKQKKDQDRGEEKTEKEEKTGLLKATGQETLERTKDLLAESFPLLTGGTYKRALQSIPGVGLATSVAKRADIFKGFPSTGGIFGGILGKKKEDKKNTDVKAVEQDSFSVTEKILDEVIKIREALEGSSGEKKGRKVLPADKKTTDGDALKPPVEESSSAELKEGYYFEPKKGKGQGGYKSKKTNRYVKKEEAVAVKKPGITKAVEGADAKPGKSGPLKKAAGTGRAALGVGRAAVGTLGRAAAGVAGGAVGALKLGAIVTALAMFLPKDIKSVIGSIIEGILQGLGFDQDTIEAIFTPFMILSDLAELIKKILGTVWDTVKWVFKTIGEIFDWIMGRSKVNASEEISRATGGLGSGEFVTGGEGPAESVPIPSTSDTGEAPEKSKSLAEVSKGGAFFGKKDSEAVRAMKEMDKGMMELLDISIELSEPFAKPGRKRDKLLAEIRASKEYQSWSDKERAEWERSVSIENAQKVIAEAKEAKEKIKKGDNMEQMARNLEATVPNSEFGVLMKQSMLKGMESYKNPDAQADAQKLAAKATAVAKKEQRAFESVSSSDGAGTPAGAPAAQVTVPSFTGAGESSSSQVPAGASQGGEAASAPPSATPSPSAGESTGGGGGAASGGGGSGGSIEPTSAASSEGISPVSAEPSTGREINDMSKGVEIARDEPVMDSSTTVVNNGEIAAGSVTENNNKVPTPDAPRDDLDVDIFFAA